MKNAEWSRPPSAASDSYVADGVASAARDGNRVAIVTRRRGVLPWRSYGRGGRLRFFVCALVLSVLVGVGCTAELGDTTFLQEPDPATSSTRQSGAAAGQSAAVDVVSYGAGLSSSDCEQQSEHESDPNTHKSWEPVFYCHNAAGAPLYAQPSNGPVVGWMDTRKSWFVCYARGARHAGNNDVWYYTQGDRAAAGYTARNAWGYMPAVHLTTKVDPYPGIPACNGVLPVAQATCPSSGCVEPLGLKAEKARTNDIGATFEGICGDSNHDYGYHVPAHVLRQTKPDDGSLQGTVNEPVCAAHAAAIDIGMNWPASRQWLKWLIGEIRAGRITGVAEVIGSYSDDKHVMYWSSTATPKWPDVGRDYYERGGEGHYSWSHVAVFRSTTDRDHGLLRGWSRAGLVPPSPPSRPAPSSQPRVPEVECFVFDDGFQRMEGPSDAVYFAGPGEACIGDESTKGKCRKWFGRCRTKGEHVPVHFETFEDGHNSPSAANDAVYVRAAGSACVADGSRAGTCHKWFGEAKAADGRQVTCKLFDNSYDHMTAGTQAIYYRAGSSICLPDGTPQGTCRKWFGRCEAR